MVKSNKWSFLLLDREIQFKPNANILRTKYIVITVDELSTEEADVFKTIVCSETEELQDRPDFRDISPSTLNIIMDGPNSDEKNEDALGDHQTQAEEENRELTEGI